MIEYIIILTMLIELITILGRIFIGSMKKFHKKYKLPIRIHHGYLGLILIIIHYIQPHNLLLTTGSALFLSDVLHHFLILPLWIGKTEFP